MAWPQLQWCQLDGLVRKLPCHGGGGGGADHNGEGHTPGTLARAGEAEAAPPACLLWPLGHVRYGCHCTLKQQRKRTLGLRKQQLAGIVMVGSGARTGRFEVTPEMLARAVSGGGP
jgi:hypothetical protein